jgi:FixJ family two-component response regulator
LSLSGFHTRSFGSAEEAGVATWVAAAHCLVVDVQLPGASGPTFYASLQAPRPPVVFITAYDNAATRQAVSGAGGDVLLTKPFLGDVLIEAVRKAV